MKPLPIGKSISLRITALFVVIFSFMGLSGVHVPIQYSHAVAPPNIVGYQGRVLNANGTPVTDASLTFIFQIYDASSGGTCVWSNSSSTCASATGISVTLTDGLFSERLGDTGDGYSAITDATFGDDDELYLDITIAGESLTPRTRLSSVPYATNASMLDGIDSTGFVTSTTGCTDCLDFDSLSDTLSLDADTSVSAGAYDLFYNLTSNGNFIFQDGGVGFATFSGNPSGGQIDFTANNDLSGGAFLDVNSGNNQTTGDLVAFTANTMAAGHILDIIQDPNGVQTVAASGNLIRAYRELTEAGSTSTGSLVHLDSNNDAGITTDSSIILEIDQQSSISTGSIVDIAQAGTGSALQIASSIGAGAASPLIDIDVSDTAYDQFLLDVTNVGTAYLANFSTTGSGGGIFLSGDASAGTLLAIENTETGYTQNSLNVRHDGSTSGFSISSAAGATVSDPLVFITNSNSAFDVDLATINYDGTASALSIVSQGTGVSDTVVSVSGDNADYVMEIYNDGDNDNREGILIQACADTNPGTGCEFATFADGNGTILGAIEGDGAGGVTNASAGSDYAELFPIGTPVSLGDIVGLNQDGRVEPAAAGSQILGAYSSNPNVLGNWFADWEEAGTHEAVALLGQVPVKVNMEGGPIQAGDYLELSSVNGTAKKASGMSFVIGRALESHTNGSGQIMTFIEPKWIMLDTFTDSDVSVQLKKDFVLTKNGTATSEVNYSSKHISLNGSAWDGVTANDQTITLYNDVLSSNAYRLIAKNTDGDTLAYLDNNGDLVVGGKIYLSDRGSIQTEKYIYYDGSSGAGGDFIRTNASGWGTGSYDFAEMFPSPEELLAGEVVIFGENSEEVKRSTGALYDGKIAGIVSTRPGFLAGDNNAGDMPIALAGRVPTKVTTENGPIEIGDPLTTSSIPGIAMKATSAGQIVGYAMESLANDGEIIVFVRPSYYDGGASVLPNNSVSGIGNITQLDTNNISLAAGSLTNISSLSGIGDAWVIEENGDISTRGRIMQISESYDGTDIISDIVTSMERTIQLSGTSALIGGRASIHFDEHDSSFMKIMNLEHDYRVFVTSNQETNELHVSTRDKEGFIVREAEGESNATIDWLVIAYHKDYTPKEINTDNIVDQNEENVSSSEILTEDEILIEDGIIDESEVIPDAVDASVEGIDEVIPEEEIDEIIQEETSPNEEIIEEEISDEQDTQDVIEEDITIVDEPVTEQITEIIPEIEADVESDTEDIQNEEVDTLPMVE